MNDLITVKKFFELHSDLFSQFGFLWKSAKDQHTEVIKNSVVFDFLKAEKTLVLSITFFPAEGALNGGFNAYIINKVDHATAENMLSIDDYIRIHSIDSPINFIYKKGDNFDIFFEKCMSDLKHLLAGPLQDVIEGKTWETTPIDWQGYK